MGLVLSAVPPPSGLVLGVHRLEQGTQFVRVAVDNLGTTEPSSSLAPRRFSPVLDRSGRAVPVLYAGEDLGCALGETVFHDLGDDPAAPAEISELTCSRCGLGPSPPLAPWTWPISSTPLSWATGSHAIKLWRRLRASTG